MLNVKLKEQAKAKGKTLTDIHNETGISMNTLSVLGRGGSNGIQFDTLEKICVNLSITPSDLLVIEPDKYDVMVSMQPENHNDFGVLKAFAVKRSVIDESAKTNIMYNADENEFNFLITYLGTTGNNDLSHFFIGLPVETDFSSGVTLKDKDVQRTKNWLLSLEKAQIEDIAKQSASIYLHNYRDKPYPDKAYVAVNFGETSSPIYPFWVGSESGSLVPLSFGSPKPIRPSDLK